MWACKLSCMGSGMSREQLERLRMNTGDVAPQGVPVRTTMVTLSVRVPNRLAQEVKLAALNANTTVQNFVYQALTVATERRDG